MDLTPIGRAAVEAREGNVLTAYRDSKGIWTISVGITTASGLIVVKPGLTITAEQSDALFAAAVEKYSATVRAALAKPVPQPFFDACVSLCINIGQTGFAHSTVVRLANAGEIGKAVDAFLMWNKPAEIITRRQGERDQAALANYAAGAVYGKRGDRTPVRTLAGKLVAPAQVPDPMTPLTKPAAATNPAPGATKAPSAATREGAAAVPASAPAPGAAARPSLFGALAALFRK